MFDTAITVYVGISAFTIGLFVGGFIANNISDKDKKLNKYSTSEEIDKEYRKTFK